MTTSLASQDLLPPSPPGGSLHRREIQLPDKRVILLVLPRVDPASLQALQEELDTGSFDAVAVALDEQRREWLTDRYAWESLDLLDILRQKKGRLLNSYLALRIFQKRFGSFDGCEPGDEMCLAIAHAEKYHLPVHLIDRNMQTTGLRAWRLTPSLKRARLVLAMTTGTYRRTRLRDDVEDPARRLDKLETRRRFIPEAVEALLDERNLYMARRIREIDARELAVIVESVHAEEIGHLLTEATAEPRLGAELDLDHVPPRKLSARLMPWLLMALILGLFVLGFAVGDPSALQEAAWIWVIVNSTATALTTATALAHPLAILAAAISSPIVSFNPAIGAGTVAALVQAFLVPPSISHIERVGDDLARLSGWWTNHLARLMLIFVFANLGSSIGTVIALALFPDIFS